jgi:hypothetical protein
MNSIVLKFNKSLKKMTVSRSYSFLNDKNIILNKVKFE